MTIQVRSNDPAEDARVNALSAPAEKVTPEKKPAEEAASESAPAPEEETEAEEATESETEAAETESETGEETETETEGTETSEEEGKEAAAGKDETKPKKKGGFQRRIDKLNARFADKEREAEFWKAKAMEGPKPAGAKTEETAAAVPGKPKADDFKTNEEFVEAMADWKADQKLAARDAKASETAAASEHNKVMEAHMSRVTEFKKSKPDFDEVITDADDLVDPSPVMRQMIVTSEVGPAILYELAKDPDECNRISKLGPIATAREMAKIELRLAPKASGSKAPEPKKKVTQAPKPLAPVGGGSTKGTAKSIYEADRMSQAEYEKARAEQKRRQASP